MSGLSGDKEGNSFLNKILSGEAAATALSGYASFNWIATVIGASGLAAAIYHYFDNWFNSVTTAIISALSYINLHFNIETIKIGIVYTGLVIFAIHGVKDLISGKQKISNSSEAIWAILATQLLAAVSFLKVIDIWLASYVQKKIETGQCDDYGHVNLYGVSILDRIQLVTGFCAPLFVVTLIFYTFFKFGIKKSYLFSYYASALTTAALIVLPNAILFIFALATHANTLVLSAINLILVFTLAPACLLSLNPKRLRQITILSVGFIGFFLLSYPIGIVFPGLITKFDSGPPPACSVVSLPE